MEQVRPKTDQAKRLKFLFDQFLNFNKKNLTKKLMFSDNFSLTRNIFDPFPYQNSESTELSKLT